MSLGQRRAGKLLLSLKIRRGEWDRLLRDRLSACRCPFSFPTTGHYSACGQADAHLATITRVRGSFPHGQRESKVDESLFKVPL